MKLTQPFETVFRRYTSPIICTLLCLAVVVPYWQVRHFDFVNYDDNTYVTENRHVLSGPTAQNVMWAFSTGKESGCSVYRGVRE